jgi:hypothetical protein
LLFGVVAIRIVIAGFRGNRLSIVAVSLFANTIVVGQPHILLLFSAITFWAGIYAAMTTIPVPVVELLHFQDVFWANTITIGVPGCARL